MTAEIGQYALILALMVSAVGGVLTLAGAELASRSWMRVGMAAAAVLAVLATIAIGALAWGFVESDFSILNVARNSNIALPWYYKLAAVWGSHEGSILFWVTTLAWWIFAVALSARHLPERVLARILGTLFIITFGLYLFILTTSNPFLRLFPPAEAGADLNPLLQDPGMIFHPPLLYLGYVGFAVPFAFAVAALLGGRLDVAWARWMRPWTTASWVLLTLGISLGSYWSYYELGWGGWWAWDPVENASLMPWLTGTALMHSLAVTEKRGAFKIWTVFLAILTFSLSLLGTFLVRSGVLTSVHAFGVRPGPRHVYSYFPRDCDRRVLPAFCLAGRLGRIGGVLLGTVARIAPHGKQSAPRRRYGDRALRHALSAFPGCCRRRPHHRGRAVL